MSPSRRGGKKEKEKGERRNPESLRNSSTSMRGRKTQVQGESGSRIPTPLPVAVRIPKGSSWKSSNTWRKL